MSKTQESCTSRLWQPVTFDLLLSHYSLTDRRVWLTILTWIATTVIALAVTIFLLPPEWISVTNNPNDVIHFFLFNPALILGIILFFWFGFEWGFIPIFLCSFIIAFHSSMSWGWALIFGIAFVLGLAICAIAYQGFRVSYDLRSTKSIVFYLCIMFIASIGSSLGAFIWSFNHHLSALETLVIWKSWWSGSFLQAIFITGPVLCIFTPAVERLKNRWFDMYGSPTVSIRWVFGAVTSITLALALFIFSGKLLGKMRVQEMMTEQKAATMMDVMSAMESFEIISWISLGVIVVTGYGAFNLINSRNNRLSEEVENRTRQLKESQEELEVLLDEKEVLLKEIHHRVKNNMALVSALLELQERSSDNQSHSNLKAARSRIMSMALAHEALYQRDSFSDISMKEYIQRVGTLTHESFAGNEIDIDLKFHLEDANLDMSKSIPLGLLINEILINAHKHAFPGRQKGCIRLESKVNENKIHISIRDNGIGLPGSAKERRNGTIGMTLIRRFSKQLMADLAIESKQDCGTSYSLTFAV